MFRLAASPSIRPAQGESVSERLRREKELLLGNGPAVPITGQYYDVIRATQQVRTSAPRALTNAFVRGINNKSGGVKSFAAANYNYPSGQMVIGASLAGMCGSCGSPAMERQRQMAKLMGLGAIPDPELAQQIRIAAGIASLIPKFPQSLDVGNEVCDTVPLLMAAADYVEKTGLDLPFDTGQLSADIDAIKNADFSDPAAIAGIAVAGGRLASNLIAINRAIAPLVKVCRPKNPQQSAPPPQSAPPAAPPSPRRVPPRLTLPGVPNLRRNIPTIRVLNLPPPKPLIPGPTSSSAGNAGIIAAGVAAVGVAAFLLLRKKKAAAA